MVAPGTRRKISRHALYDMVWSRAMIHLSKEFGLSDVGFAKLCKRNKIPRPPRGYWALREVGKAPPPTPLPSPEEDWNIVFVWHKVYTGAADGDVDVKTEEMIEVADTLQDPHPLVKEALRILAHAPKDEYGIRLPPDGCLEVRVSDASRDRALRIMDALIKAFEKREIRVEIYGEHSLTRAMIGQSEVYFGISEAVEIVKREMPDDESESMPGKGEYVFHHSRFVEATEPSGKLTVALRPGYHRAYSSLGGFRLKWADGSRQVLEKCLHRVFAVVVSVAQTMERMKADEERRLREEALARKRAEEAARIEAVRLAEIARVETENRARLEAERERERRLRRDAADWSQSQNLRLYIEAVKSRAMAEGVPFAPGTKVGEWMDWALRQADQLDPLKRAALPSLDDQS
jgi:hypothetical protein